MRLVLFSLILFVIGSVSESASAGLFCPRGGGKPESCCSCGVRYVCCPVVTREPVKKKCHDVEYEPICIPSVLLPWQRCCERKCARVRYVARLKSRQYECGTRCVTHWEVKTVSDGCIKPYGSCAPASNFVPPAPVN